MAKNAKSSQTSKTAKNEKVNASDMKQVINAASAVAAPAGAGLTAGGAGGRKSAVAAAPAGIKKSFAPDVMDKKEAANAVTAASAAVGAGRATSHDVNITLSAGVASVASVGAGRASAVASAVMDEKELKIIEFRQRVARCWAAPEWSGAAALRSVLAGAGLSEDQINAAVAAAGRKSGEDLTAPTPTLSEVVGVLAADYSKEFETLCGCAVPSAGDVRIYSYSSLSLSTITADSKVNDYVIFSAVPAGLSASSLVAAVLSVRVLVDVQKRIKAAAAAARADLFTAAAGVARMALKLGVSADVISRYMGLKMSVVGASDEKEVNRLQKNYKSCFASLRAIENNIVLAAPAGAFGAIADGCGGWCFPASLPTSAPAKVRKLWAKRVRVLSSMNTLQSLLSAAGVAVAA